MKLNRIALPFVLLVGIAIGFAIAHVAAAQRADKTGALLTVAMDSIPGKEARMWLREIPPGEKTSLHYHPGDVLTYVLEGSVVHTIQGKAPVIYKAGEVFHETAKDIHFGANPSKSVAAKLLAIQIADQDQPATIPVK